VIIVMLIGQGMKLLNRSINAFSPEIQSPIKESALHFVDMRVFDNDCPRADPGFSPDIY
jgi:hypothetical protein